MVLLRFLSLGLSRASWHECVVTVANYSASWGFQSLFILGHWPESVCWWKWLCAVGRGNLGRTLKATFSKILETQSLFLWALLACCTIGTYPDCLWWFPSFPSVFYPSVWYCILMLSSTAALPHKHPQETFTSIPLFISCPITSSSILVFSTQARFWDMRRGMDISFSICGTFHSMLHHSVSDDTPRKRCSLSSLSLCFPWLSYCHRNLNKCMNSFFLFPWPELVSFYFFIFFTATLFQFLHTQLSSHLWHLHLTDL